MRTLTVLFLVCGLSCTPADPVPTGDAPAPDPTITPAMTFHDLSATDIHGVPVQMSRFKGHKVLVVNTASECGYTPQYAQLEELYRTYKDKGLVVVGFPSNSFGGQEPGSADEIVAFCERNYGVTFPLMEKVKISRNDPHPVYRWLTSHAENGVMDAEVKWNFHKFTIDEEGRLVGSFPSDVSPLDPAIINWVEGR